MGRTGGFTVPDGTETIGKYSFNCSELEKINFNDKLKNIEYSAFKDTSITEFYLPDSIEKLKGLRYLTLTGEITNAGKLSGLDELTVLCINESAAADLSFLETLDSVEAVEFISYGYPERTADGSADYYSPIYKMKNLKYLIVNTWGNSITEEQIAHIHENAPWINIVYYKIG